MQFSLWTLAGAVFLAAVFFGLWHYHALLGIGAVAIALHLIVLILSNRTDHFAAVRVLYGSCSIAAGILPALVVAFVSFLVAQGSYLGNDFAGTLHYLIQMTLVVVACSLHVLVVSVRSHVLFALNSLGTLVAGGGAMTLFLNSPAANQFQSNPFRLFDLEDAFGFWIPFFLVTSCIAWISYRLLSRKQEKPGEAGHSALA